MILYYRKVDNNICSWYLVKILSRFHYWHHLQFHSLSCFCNFLNLTKSENWFTEMICTIKKNPSFSVFRFCLLSWFSALIVFNSFKWNNDQTWLNIRKSVKLKRGKKVFTCFAVSTKHFQYFPFTLFILIWTV